MKKTTTIKPFVLAFFCLILTLFVLSITRPSFATPSNLTVSSLSFSDQTIPAKVILTHSTPITMGDGAQMISGGAAGDFNNDGWQDLFVIGGGYEADKLFINQKDGTFEDMAASAGLAELHMGSGVAVGDYNGDGWQDIYVTSMGAMGNMGPGQHRLYHNNGDLTFTDVAIAAGVNQAAPIYADGTGASFGDYDLDGDLDLFVAGWRSPLEGNPAAPAPALGNRLFRNNGNGTFTDVSATAVPEILADGSGPQEILKGFSPCFADMDGDRYPELLMVGDFGTTLYFINDTDGTFTERIILGSTELGQEWSGMGSAIGDVNQDGRVDWFVTAIYDLDHIEQNGRGDGNKLYINQDSTPHTFSEVAASAGVDDDGWGWGTVIVDLDHDGDEDIVATNGWEFNDSGPEEFKDENAKIWLNDGTGTAFTEIDAAAIGLDHNLHGIGMMNLDYDNDGDQDIAITAYNDEFRLYRNDLTGNSTNWLRIFLNTQNAQSLAPNGIGSRIEVKVGNNTYYHYMNSCSHYLSQSEISAHFGLGDAAMIDEVKVIWADGSTTVMTDINVNQTLMIIANPLTTFLPIVQTP